MTLNLYDGAKLIGSANSERAARAMARKYLGCSRVSEWSETDGWCLYPTGADEDTERVIRVVVA